MAIQIFQQCRVINGRCEGEQFVGMTEKRVKGDLQQVIPSPHSLTC